LDFGEVQGLRIDVMSETGWFDDAAFKDTMMAHGGTEQSQYAIPWAWDNAGAYAALITVTTLDGNEKRILLDTGWNTDWMDYVYERYEIPQMLERGEIDFMVLSHWHLDHFWGIESTLKHNPGLTIYAPATCKTEDLALLQEKAHHTAEDIEGRSVHLCKNDVAHEGDLIPTDAVGEEDRGIYSPMRGLAIRMFDVPILLQVQGENVLYFNVKDGIV
jgi:7,8-dihydropterin-6-yl-methyl-4-(beta-D-ribofuranosyl)aminobenzene 5'-phosphate synthase